jgi:ATP-dependent RNA helicase RhlE
VTTASFDLFDLHPRVLAGVKKLGYKTPTPIQAQAIPIIMKGGDVMGLAQTGTGKTAAFILPILHKLQEGPRGKVRVLIVSPTRELAQQIHDAIEELDSGLRSVTLYGGVSINPQIQKLKRGAEIVVACPGRLLDHVERRTIQLNTLEVLVLDEADQMFDMGFLPNIRRILQQLPKTRQSLLFSATMPKDVRQLAHDILSNPETVQIGHAAPTKSVTQALYPVSEHLKTDLLIKILETTGTGSVLIFTRTKHRAKSVAQKLNRAGHKATSMQGNLSQRQRQTALDDFREGKLQILVATDIASRGIDVARISHVINFDMPDTVEAYTHRIGRTGRAAKEGDAFTLVTRQDMSRIRSVERVLGAKLKQLTLPDFDYTAKSTAHREMPEDRDEYVDPRARFGQQGRPAARAPRSYRPAARQQDSGQHRSADGQRSRPAQQGGGSSSGQYRTADGKQPPRLGGQRSRPAYGDQRRTDGQQQRSRSAQGGEGQYRSAEGQRSRPAYGDQRRADGQTRTEQPRTGNRKPVFAKSFKSSSDARSAADAHPAARRINKRSKQQRTEQHS